MKTISDIITHLDITQKTYKVVKPRKDDNRRELIGRLSEATGRTKRSIYFSTIDFPDSWLKDVLEDCIHFTGQKAKNFKFGEWLKLAKGEN